MKNYCSKCNGRGSVAKKENTGWYNSWKYEKCSACSGVGYARPPGYPDKKKMERISKAVLNNYLGR